MAAAGYQLCAGRRGDSCGRRKWRWHQRLDLPLQFCRRRPDERPFGPDDEDSSRLRRRGLFRPVLRRALLPGPDAGWQLHRERERRRVPEHRRRNSDLRRNGAGIPSGGREAGCASQPKSRRGCRWRWLRRPDSRKPARNRNHGHLRSGRDLGRDRGDVRPFLR